MPELTRRRKITVNKEEIQGLENSRFWEVAEEPPPEHRRRCTVREPGMNNKQKNPDNALSSHRSER